MRRLRYQCGMLIGFLLLSVATPVHATESAVIENSDAYFPDDVGNSWSYRGEVTEGPIQTIERKMFVNESKVTGADVRQNVQVKVMHDTNAGNHGPSTSFYRRDAAGVVYYGSEPGTTLETQLIPYQIVQFPLRPGSTFQQFDRRDLDFGSDLDRDGVNEHADVVGTVTVVGRESVTVPAGSYPDAVRIDARMTLRITFSADRRVAVGTDVMNAWFVKGIGLVKYVERQELPAIRNDRGITSEISEELLEFKPGAQARSFERSEAAPEGVLTHHTGDQKL